MQSFTYLLIGCLMLSCSEHYSRHLGYNWPTWSFIQGDSKGESRRANRRERKRERETTGSCGLGRASTQRPRGSNELSTLIHGTTHPEQTSRRWDGSGHRTHAGAARHPGRSQHSPSKPSARGAGASLGAPQALGTGSEPSLPVLRFHA